MKVDKDNITIKFNDRTSVFNIDTLVSENLIKNIDYEFD